MKELAELETLMQKSNTSVETTNRRRKRSSVGKEVNLNECTQILYEILTKQLQLCIPLLYTIL
jgi:hypothetical protein